MNKKIGSIPYSLALHSCNPSDKNAVNKIYPFAQERETVDLKLLSQHIKEHGSPYSEGTIYGVLTDMVTCTIEMLEGGYGVRLDGLVKLGVTIRADGADETADVNTQNFEVRPKLTAERSLKKTLNIAPEFEYVDTRENQAAAKKAAKQAIDAELGVGDGDDNGGDNNGGDNGGDDEPGGDVTE